MRGVGGLKVFGQRAGPGVQRPGQWLPRCERYYLYRMSGRDYLVLWKPFAGLFPLSSVPIGSPGTKDIIQFVNLESKRMKKLSLQLADSGPLPPLSADSVMLKKLPRLCEFLSHTQYDDGSPRAPGRLWLDNDGVAYTVTLFEPSAQLRVRLRGNTIDDALILAEKHLGAENAPWEVDQYAREKALGKKKK